MDTDLRPRVAPPRPHPQPWPPAALEFPQCQKCMRGGREDAKAAVRLLGWVSAVSVLPDFLLSLFHPVLGKQQVTVSPQTPPWVQSWTQEPSR